MKRTKFGYSFTRKPQQPRYKRPQSRIIPIYLGDVMRQAVARRRAKANAKKTN